MPITAHADDMPVSRRSRVLMLALLLALLFGLAIGFGAEELTRNPQAGDYPEEDQLVLDYDAFLGDRVQVTGTVVRLDPVVIVARYDAWTGDHYRTGTIWLEAAGLSRSVRIGERLQLYGIVRPDGVIQVESSVVVPPGNVLYMFGVSALAGVWVLVRFVRQWRFDLETLAVRRRAEPYSMLAPIRARVRPEESDA